MIDLIKALPFVIVLIATIAFIVWIIASMIVDEIESNRTYERERLQRSIQRLERELGLVELDKPSLTVYGRYDEVLARDTALLRRAFGSRNPDDPNEKLLGTERK